MTDDDVKYILRNIKRGDIMLVISGNPVSELIGWFDDGPFSHTVAAKDPIYIIEASADGVIEDAIFKYIDSDHQCCLIRPDFKNERQVEKFIKSLTGYIGHGYDYGGLIGFGLYYILKWFGITIKNVFASNYRVLCSEVIARALAKVDKRFDLSQYEKDNDFNLVSPNDIYRRAKIDDTFEIMIDTVA